MVQRDVLIPPYPPFVDGFIYFMYFPGDDIRVVVTRIGLGYPGFPFDINYPSAENNDDNIARFLDQTHWTDPKP